MFKFKYFVFLIIILHHTSFCICYIANYSIGRILQGKRAELKDFPHVTEFFNERALCGANIITSRALITAAHCLDKNTDVSLMICVIGNTGDKMLHKSVQTVPIWDAVVHADYDSVNFHCDIAALFTEDPIPLGETVQRALIVDTDEFIDEKRPAFIATGWGWTQYPNGSVSHEGLKMVSLLYVEKQKCMKMTGMTVGDDAFCLDGEDGADTCVGDSGSAIMWNGMIVGLVSCGEGCGPPASAGLYSDVFNLMSWIEDAIDKFHIRLCDFIEKKKRGEIAH